MVRHVVEAALASQARPVVVVLGHQQHEVRQALRGLQGPVRGRTRTTRDGLSTSLRAGLAALPAEVAGAVVCLGDMPRVSAALIDRLIAAFDPVEGRAHRGADLARQARQPGAVGAHVLRRDAGRRGRRRRAPPDRRACRRRSSRSRPNDGAALLDIDTPEALAAYAEAAA